MDLSILEKKLKEETDPVKAAELLVNGVANALEELTHDPVAIKRMAQSLRSKAGELGSAFAFIPVPEPAHTQTAPITPPLAPRDYRRK